MAQEGDRKAFDLLYMRWQARLLRFAYRQTGNADAAQDVMQDAAMAIAKNIGRLEDPSRFSPWAYTIVRRRAADYINRTVRHRRIVDEVSQLPEPETGLSLDDKLTLKQAIAALPDMDRKLLTLFYTDGMSGAEIAAGLGVPIGTIKSRLFSARKHLKSIYETHPKGDNMNDFDKNLAQILSAEDEQFIANSLEETGFYSEVFGSLKGRGSFMHKMTWLGILAFSSILFFSIWKFFQVETVRDQIMFASLAVMANSAQIALKLWFNTRLNRRAIIREVKRLQLAITRN